MFPLGIVSAAQLSSSSGLALGLQPLDLLSRRVESDRRGKIRAPTASERPKETIKTEAAACEDFGRELRLSASPTRSATPARRSLIASYDTPFLTTPFVSAGIEIRHRQGEKASKKRTR